MNWKSFVSQANLVKSWLNECGYNDDRILFKAFVLILRGVNNPNLIIAAAISDISIREAAKINIHNIASYEDIPDNIYTQMIRWVHLLPRKPEILGDIYEKLALHQRTQGLYYTPPPIIDFILSNTICRCELTLNPKLKILDPACGCGSFLLKAYDLLFAKFISARSVLSMNFPANEWSDLEIHKFILKYNLWGADIDSLASDIASASLMLKQPSAGLSSEPNIIVFDSLKRTEDMSAASSQERFFWSQNYDYVVGNPPYLSFGLRGARKENPQYLDYLRNTYTSAQYKLSIYALFIERGIKLLTSGGKLGFIIPDTFLLGRYYSRIREYILENTHIDLIAHISSQVFKNATTGYLAICIFTKHIKSSHNRTNLIDIYRPQDPMAIKNATPICQYEQSYFYDLPHKRFRIFFSDQAKQLIEHLDATGIPLKAFASGHTGIRALAGQKNIISTTPQTGETWHRGLISGSQVQRYFLQYRNHWLDIDPQKLYKGGWNDNIINRRKILIRQTGYSITGAIDNEKFYHLNNIHSLIVNNSSLTLDYILLLLNSRLIAFYYHVVTMEFGRSMAQIDIETLELIPIAVDPQINLQAPSLVKIMEKCIAQELKWGRWSDHKKSVAFDEYLNQLVYRIYGLSDEEIKYIDNYEAKLAASSENNPRKR